jgi:hypothetical protein
MSLENSSNRNRVYTPEQFNFIVAMYEENKKITNGDDVIPFFNELRPNRHNEQNTKVFLELHEFGFISLGMTDSLNGKIQGIHGPIIFTEKGHKELKALFRQELPLIQSTDRAITL